MALLVMDCDVGIGKEVCVGKVTLTLLVVLVVITGRVDTLDNASRVAEEVAEDVAGVVAVVGLRLRLIMVLRWWLLEEQGANFFSLQ